MIGASIRHGLANLSRFTGRDRPGQFWPYALIVTAAAMVAWAAIFVPALLSMMRRMQDHARAHPDEVTVTHGAGGVSIEARGPIAGLWDGMDIVFIAMGMIAMSTAFLLAATVTRRLHDSNRRGWWGLPPLILFIGGAVGMAAFFAGDGREIGGWFALLFINNLAYIASLGVLVVLLLLAGTPGPNRYGAAPD